MAQQVISVTEAARNFSDVINRVVYQGQTYLLTRGGAVVAQLSAPQPNLTGAELARRWNQRPRLDPIDAIAWEEEISALQSSVPPLPESVWDS